MRLTSRYVAILGIVLLCLLTAILALTSGAQGIARTPRIIYIPKVEDTNNDFWTSLIEGVKMYADENDVNLTIDAPASEEDYRGQIACIDRAIAENPDAILLSPISYTEVTAAANRVITANIKLVLIDSTIDEELQSLTVQTDNYEAGRKLGTYLMDHTIQGCNIGIVAHVKGSSTAIEREEGLRSAIDGSRHVIETVYSDSDYEKGYEVTKDLLERHPEIDVIAGLNEYSAVGAARAVQDLGLTDKIKMFGFDSSLEEVQMLERGTFSAVVVQKPFNMGYLGIENTIKLLRGEKVEGVIDSGSALITKNTIYSPENEKLLFPFSEY